jgi:putative redox protein
VEVALSAQLEGTPPRFTEIELQVSSVYQDKEELEKLVIIAERGCIVANTIKEAVVLKTRVK